MWILYGIVGYLTGLFISYTLGTNEHTHWVRTELDWLIPRDNHRLPLHTSKHSHVQEYVSLTCNKLVSFLSCTASCTKVWLLTICSLSPLCVSVSLFSPLSFSLPVSPPFHTRAHTHTLTHTLSLFLCLCMCNCSTPMCSCLIAGTAQSLSSARPVW